MPIFFFHFIYKRIAPPERITVPSPGMFGCLKELSIINEGSRIAQLILGEEGNKGAVLHQGNDREVKLDANFC